MSQQEQFEKFFPPDFTIETLRVIIRSMKPGDFDAFVPLTTKSPELWKYFTKDLSIESELNDWVKGHAWQSPVGVLSCHSLCW